MVENKTHPLDQISAYLPPHLARYLTSGIELVEIMTISKHIRAVRGVLSTYLPRYLVESIHHDPVPGKVNGGFHYGAVLFADVSGFTAMSEKLSVLGKEGAEEVTGIVNDYFTAMLEINNSYGGDLLKFGGDALLIFFEGNLGPHHALAAGRAMMNAMSRFTQVNTSQGVFPLRMKIGMSCGSVFLASLGTPESMDHAVMGRTLFNMAQAENNASPGEIILDDPVREVTNKIARFSPLVEGFWKLEELHSTVEVPKDTHRDPNSGSPDTGFDPEIMVSNLLRDGEIISGLRPFVPEELFARIIDDPQRITVYGSHRPVTITFTNFLGIDEIIETLGPKYEDSITNILNHYFITMSEVITRFGGTVNRLDAYSVGQRILALFGALQAHEDDPQRAVRVALEMNSALQMVNQETKEILSAIPEYKEKLDVEPLKQRVGVNSGFVFAGNTGSKIRREYTVMGDQVNLTARLMGIAQEGEVLIGESTARQTEEIFNLKEKEAVKVKGKTKPVRSFAVSGIRERSHWKTRLASNPIVGRDEELSLARETVEEVINGEARVLVISGVSGLGKTRLAEELAWYGDSKGMDLLVGTCLSYGKTMTYHPWAEVLREVFGISITDQSQDTQSRVEALRRGMAAIGEEPWTPVMGTVLGLDIPDNDLTRDLDSKLRRQRVLDLTVKLLKVRAQSKPLLLVVEDAHWADPASMDLIDYVARNIYGHPILLMLPHRPDIDLPDWTTYSHSVDLELADLSDEYCKQIIHDMLGGLQLPEAIYHIVLSRACGNPFFVGEVVRALIDAGALKKDESGAFHVVHDMSGMELPDTIHGVIISRIDRLIASDRRILQVASVIGRVFAYLTLDGVYPYENIETTLHERLNYLNELGLTEVQVIETELYRFIHLTTREVVYEGLPFEHRRSLHREIGGFIEDQSVESLGEQTSLLAYHYYEGQAWKKAMEYNLSAAQNAQREFANETAILSGKRALEAATNLEPEVDTSQSRIAAHETLGEVMTLVGQYDEALQQYELARGLVEVEQHTPERLTHLAELARKTAEVFERRSEYEVAFDWMNQGLSYVDDGKPTIEAVRIYILKAGVYFRQGKLDDAITWCQKTLEVASHIVSREGQQVVAQAYYNLGHIHTRRGDMALAVKFCNDSIRIYQEIDDVLGQARAYNNLAIAYTDQGDWKNAGDALSKSLEINQRIGNIQEQGFIANNLANIHLYRGEWDEAENLYKQSNKIWRQVGAALPEAVVLSNLAQVNIYQENLKEAAEALNRSQDIFTDLSSEDFLAELERRWGEYYLKANELDEAWQHTNRSIELATSQEGRLDQGISLRILGEVYQARREFEEAEMSLEHSLRILTDLNSEYEAAKTMLSLAYLAFDREQMSDRTQFDQAIEILEKLGAKADLERAENLKKQLDN
jgi:class 3 adenylate cyclase/tetratricopeptide (TPR) repeat protein